MGDGWWVRIYGGDDDAMPVCVVDGAGAMTMTMSAGDAGVGSGVR